MNTSSIKNVVQKLGQALNSLSNYMQKVSILSTNSLIKNTLQFRNISTAIWGISNKMIKMPLCWIGYESLLINLNHIPTSYLLLRKVKIVKK